jgi:hypothetical protein
LQRSIFLNPQTSAGLSIVLRWCLAVVEVYHSSSLGSVHLPYEHVLLYAKLQKRYNLHVSTCKRITIAMAENSDFWLAAFQFGASCFDRNFEFDFWSVLARKDRKKMKN